MDRANAEYANGLRIGRFFAILVNLVRVDIVDVHVPGTVVIGG